MSGKRGGLGRGLGAIFGSHAKDNFKPQDVVSEIFVSAVQPNRYQPRKEFSQEALQELAESIKAYGILQPIIVRKLGLDSYELIAGERRLRASKIAGLEKIPAIIREYTDAQTSEISIIENVQRQDLNAMEEAHAYERLIRDFGHTQEELAIKIGCSRSYISNLLRLLNLAPQVREFVSKGLLSMGQAIPLLAIENELLQTKAAQMIVAEDLSVRKVKAFVNEMKNSGLIISEKQKKFSSPVQKNQSEQKKEKIFSEEKNFSDVQAREKISEPENISYVQLAEDKLSEIVGAEVKIISEASKKQIQINFSDNAQLQQIVRKLEHTIPNSGGKPVTTKEEKISALRKFSTEGKF